MMHLSPFRRDGALLLTLTLAIGLAACGDDATGPDDDEDDGIPPGATGMVHTRIQDDPNFSDASEGYGSLRMEQANFTGVFRGQVDVELSQDNGQTWTSLGAPREFELSLQQPGSGIEVIPLVEVDAGRYTSIRLNMANLTVVLDEGSQIDDQILTSDITIRIGEAGEDLSCRADREFLLGADGQAVVLFEMNSEAWLDLQAATARQVAKHDVEEHAQLSVVVER